MRQRYIPAFIVLLAGAVTSIINIVNKVELMTGLKRLLLVIVVFYIVGLIVKHVVKIALTKYKKSADQEDEQPDTDNISQADEKQKLDEKQSK